MDNEADFLVLWNIFTDFSEGRNAAVWQSALERCGKFRRFLLRQLLAEVLLNNRALVQIVAALLGRSGR